MNQFKKSGSGFLLSKINKFNKLKNETAYNKNYEKIAHMEFEIESQREIILKLNSDLNKKTKELKELISINQIKKNNNEKKIQIIEKILKILELKKEPKKELKLKIDTDIDNELNNNNFKSLKDKDKDKDKISNNINSVNDENDIDNKTNRKTFYTTNNNFTNKKHVLPKIKSPKIKSNLFINTNMFMKKKKLRDMLYLTTLKNQINTLNEKIEKKKEEITEYQTKNEKNKNIYPKLETDLMSNYDKIKELKYKNAEMCANLEDITENYYIQREEYFKLKNKLNDYINIFENYQQNTEKNNLELEKKLKYYDEKNLECILYHNYIVMKGRNMSKHIEDNRSKLTEAGNMIEKMNEEIEEVKNDIESKNKYIKIYKDEVSKLNNKHKEVNDNNKNIKTNIENMNIKMETKNKINQDKENINKNLNKQLKEKKKKYKSYINKIKEIKDLIKNKDKEINALKEEFEKIKISKNVFKMS